MIAGLAAPFAALAQNEVEELVVTGSRLPTTAFSSPAPVLVILTDDASLEGQFDPGEILQSSTVGLGSPQQGVLLTGFVESGGPGVSTISLRGLGDQRTLVMMNGRRLPPAGVGGQVGAVDLNILPSAAIARYEILKDGASSVYGSDAVAGVVNIITSELEGGRIGFDTTISEEGGGEEHRLSGAYGGRYGNARFQVAGEWYQREALNLGDRDYLDCATPYTFDPNTGARNDMIDPSTGKPKCVSTTGNSVGYFDVFEAVYNGTLAAPAYGRRIPISAGGVGAGADPNLPLTRNVPLAERDYDPALEDDATVLTPTERYTLFLEGDVDLGSAELYGEFLWSRRESEQKAWQTIFQSIYPFAPCSVNPLVCTGASTLPPYNPFDPPPYSPSMAATPGYGGYYHLGWSPMTQFLAPREQEQRVNVTRSVLGLRGDLGFKEGWTWDAYVSYSRSRGEYERTAIYADRMQAVTGTDMTGMVYTGVCPVGSAPGCTPLNFFTDDILLTGALPQSYLDYLLIHDKGETDYDQVIAEAVVSGTLFQAPAGPVDAAFGVSYRRDWLDDRPGEEAAAGNYWGSATAGPTKGEDSVREVFGEVSAPVIASLTFNLSGRLSDYDSYGSNSTYKAGFNWRVIEDLRVRGTIGTSFRAPALYEQSLNDQTGFLAQRQVDPCILWGESSNAAIRANCAAEGLPSTFTGPGPSAALLVGGGDDLEPEESDQRSLGVVWTPEALGLSLAADYWEVDIDNEVASLAAAVVGQCYSSADFPDNPYCDLFARSSTGTRAITFVDASYRNVVNQQTRGLDLTAAAFRDIGPGKASAAVEATWTLDDKRELFPGRVDDINGTIGQPEFVAQGSLRYETGAWTAAWNVDYIGEQSNYEYQFGNRCEAAGINAFAGAAGGAAYCAKNHVEAVWYHHASVRYQADDWSFTGGVRNLFDEQPPAVSPAIEPDMGDGTYSRIGQTPGTSQYDLVGRRFFLGVKKSF